ncbi:hypothetical protein [Haloarchaeobius iranensis]|nr:hypothetical protein [Haloarchaeobius iranensis]
MTESSDHSLLTPGGALWDWQRFTPSPYRNQFWKRTFGNPKKRDTYLSLQAARKVVLRKGEVADRVLSFPSFQDREDVTGGDLSDAGHFEPTLQHGGAYTVPKVNRPGDPLLVRVPAVLDWLVDPFHAPVDPIVARVVAYINDKTSDWSYDPGFKVTNRPLKAYWYAKTADFYDLEVDSSEDERFTDEIPLNGLPTVEFEEFGPYEAEELSGTMKGFTIKASIRGDLTVTNEYGLNNALLMLCSNVAVESTDRKPTNTVDFTDVSEGGDVDWTPVYTDETSTSETVIRFEYELKPRVSM